MKTSIFPPNELMELKFPRWVYVGFQGRFFMQAAIDRVMHTYGMIVNLTLEEEQAAREKVSRFLANAQTDDEQKLAVEGLRYLRNVGSLSSHSKGF
jgi:hypothetical protein